MRQIKGGQGSVGLSNYNNYQIIHPIVEGCVDVPTLTQITKWLTLKYHFTISKVLFYPQCPLNFVSKNHRMVPLKGI